MSTLYVSVVNHNNDSMLINNGVLANLAKIFNVVLKSNTPATEKLTQYCIDNKITLLDTDYGLGFGSNNNFVHQHCINHLNMKGNDFFLVLNPDVLIDNLDIIKLLDQATIDGSSISTINLYCDEKKSIPEQSIKKFPRMLGPLKGLFQKKRSDAYDKNKISDPTNVDWAAGSFLLFKSEIYQRLNGFDEKFFMYFEDV
ncbi:glycosyltransferase family 2 protein, partial [Photobacterium sp. OFAV2-7]|uniref:glycosyltransferase family 2 protein n=1 Tax=Photobacterium sp. OFAV2-7 TaxID=2917748 RepID=UPI001EF64C1B